MDATGSTSETVAISLSGSEAMVLAHALGEWENDGTLERLDDAAKRVLFDLAAALEPLVDDAFSVDYHHALERARGQVLGD
jgi:hypothetical protein